MARPQKSNLDYFPLDCGFFSDKKIKSLRRKFGALGIAVYLNLLCKVYGGSKGYYLEFKDLETLAYDIVEEITNSQVSKFARQAVECIYYCSDVGLIDKELLEQGIITSSSIQRQYSLSTAQAKRKAVIKEFCLVRQAEFLVEEITVNTEETTVNTEETTVNTEETQQNKRKEIKEKETKFNEESKKEIKNTTYEYIITRAREDGFFNNEQEINAVRRFIQHLFLLKKPPLNSRLETMITRLSLNFGKDSRAYIKCIDDAINGGYTKLAIE